MTTIKGILFVTGTRADFGKLEPLIVAARDAGYPTGIFVTGMHMLERYGMTKVEVHRMNGVSVHEFLNQRVGDAQDTVLAKTIIGFSDYIAEHTPDLVVVHGDRVEALACALVCATNYIRCAHIEGGEVSGTIDELFRHCNTKLASHHFVSSERAAQRVMALGETRDSIYVIGSPELDLHAASSAVTLEEVRTRYDLNFKEYGICIFHPVTSEKHSIGAQASSLFNTLELSNRCFIVILPNNDPGAEKILDVINHLPPSRFRILPSMRFSYFSELMKNASCFIGNSSAGVREAPFLGIPSLDIGTRQTNRAKSRSIYACNAENSKSISDFLDREWGRRYNPDTSFGKGAASQYFIAALSEPVFWNRGLQKKFHDFHAI
jgi:UDP-N-acetylglucosamine 2-epimerase (hydrolysing)